MTEVLATSHNFEVFGGTAEEIESWRRREGDEIAAVRQRLVSGEAVECESPPPVIIDWMPEAERDYFDNFGDEDDLVEFGRARWRGTAMPSQLAATAAVIEADFRALYPDQPAIQPVLLDLERTWSDEGAAPRGRAREMHFDSRVTGTPQVIYLLMNGFGTEFYSGPFRLLADRMPSYRDIDHQSFLADQPLAAAPPYAILRLPKLAIHRSPVADHATQRSFLRLVYRPS